MSDGVNSITKTYDLLKWLMPTVSKFPREKRFTLGERIENKLLSVLELLLEHAQVEVHLEPSADTYRSTRIRRQSDHLEPATLPGLAVAVAEILP